MIVAAGMSSRLQQVVGTVPKSLYEVGGTSLIERSIQYLRDVGIEEIVIVVGYNFLAFKERLGSSVSYIHNPWFESTNNMASLALALPILWDSEFLYLHSDLLYHPRLVERLTKEGEGDIVLLIDEKPCSTEEMKVRVHDGVFIESSKEIPVDEAIGEWTGIARFTPTGAKQMYRHSMDLMHEGHFNVYDTAAMNRIAGSGNRIGLVSTQSLPWIEIDFPEDMKDALERILPAIDSILE